MLSHAGCATFQELRWGQYRSTTDDNPVPSVLAVLLCLMPFAPTVTPRRELAVRLTGFPINKRSKPMSHDTGDNNEKQQASGRVGASKSEADKGRPDKGGTAGQSGGEQAKNRSSNPDSVK